MSIRVWLTAVGTAWFFALATAGETGQAQGAPPKVQFDVARVAACRDVTTWEFSTLNPSEKLIQVDLSISCLLPGSREGEVFQLLYRVRGQEASAQVVDYWPKTTLAPIYAGNINVQLQEHARQSLSAHASARYPLFAEAEGSAAADAERHQTQSYDRLPPLELIAASGTMQRGQGVFFKLRPSERSTLEGSRDFHLVLRVPRSWRGDGLLVQCEALCQRNQNFPSPHQERCGGQSFLVALYLQGDEPARTEALRFAEAERRLRAIAAAQRQAIHQQMYPTPLHQLAGLFDASTPKIPPDWLDQLLLGGGTEGASYLRKLPAEVRQAGRHYQLATQRLRSLNGTPPPSTRMAMTAGRP